ncbi:MAG: lysophospholipid acyltransferase family protein [Deltaproteobacteria bacterium]|nr:lysophospholipid acyltransferase family protein [Deltaproteobacteria bacterium]
MNFKHRLEYILLRSIIFFINLLPVPLVLALCSSIGMFAWVFFPFRIKVAYKNLSTVFPELDHSQKLRLLRKVYIQFTRTFGLIFILHRKRLVNLIQNAEIGNRQLLDDTLKRGNGIILTTIHASWFEAYFAWFNLHGLPTSLIYQEQSNPLSDRYFINQRKKYGTSLVNLSSSAGMKTFEKALDSNRILIVSLDQSYRGKGIWVPFFNRPLPCAKGAAILHLRTCAPVLTSVYYMDKGKLHIDFNQVKLPSYTEINEENISDISARSVRLYEPFIRKYPEQWFSIFHRLWSKKDYPEVRRSFRQVFF